MKKTEKLRIGREFVFDAAHYTVSAGGSPCEELHGHTYRLEVTVAGKVRENGMVMDFSDLKTVVEGIIKHLDHTNLNNILDNPTTENLVLWIYQKLKQALNKHGRDDLSISIKLWEGEGKWAEITE